MVDTLSSTGPSSASWASGFNAALFPWLPWPHRFLQGASCHGNAYQSIVLFAGWVRGKMTSEQKSVFIYLFCETDKRRGVDDMLKVFASSTKLAGEFWKRARGTPGGCKWRHSFLACVCSVVVSSPQADTCGFNPLYTNKLLHSIFISFSPQKIFLMSPHLSHQTCFCSRFCLFDSSLPFFHDMYFLFISLISLANIFSTLFHLFAEVSLLFFPTLCLLNTSAISILVIPSTQKSLIYFPTGASQLCHCRMYYLPLTSHCFERVMPKTSLFSRDVWLCICVSVVGVVS